MNELSLKFPKQASVAYIDNFLRAAREVRGVSNRRIVFDLSATSELSSIFVCFICGLVDLAREFDNEVSFVMPAHRRTADTLRAIKKIVPSAGRPSMMLTGSLCQLRKFSSNNSQPIQDMIEILGERLKVDKDLQDYAQLLLTELLTNAIDHSGRGECYICAGKWGKSRFLHFTVLDFGVGIPAKLKSTFPNMFKLDVDAIKHLLTKGITTRVGREGGKGYQYVQDVLRTTQGRFCLFSGDGKAAYKYDRGEYEAKTAHRPFEGTCVDLAFDLDFVGEPLGPSNQERDFF